MNIPTDQVAQINESYVIKVVDEKERPYEWDNNIMFLQPVARISVQNVAAHNLNTRPGLQINVCFWEYLYYQIQ